jgi:hypothetical protein
MSVLFQMGRQVPARFRGFIVLPAAAGSKEIVAPKDAVERKAKKTDNAIILKPVFIFFSTDFLGRTRGPPLQDHGFNLVFFRIGKDRNNGADDF